MPALRERSGDIRLLARHFVDKTCRMEGIPVKEVFNETLEHFTWYSWHGNVRQLENVMEKAVVMSGMRATLMPGDFPLPTERGSVPFTDTPATFSVPEGGIDFVQTVTSFEKNIVEQALQETNGNRTLAADLLRLKRTTLVSKLRAFETPAKPAYGGYVVEPVVLGRSVPHQMVAP
jgi:DNA-binding NtrC family response regulator